MDACIEALLAHPPLSPCPKCGSEDVALKESTGHNYSVYGRWWYYVECQGCKYAIYDREVFEHVSGNCLLIYPEKDCVTVWNAPAMAAELTALRADVTSLTASLAAAEGEAGRLRGALREELACIVADLTLRGEHMQAHELEELEWRRDNMLAALSDPAS